MPSVHLYAGSTVDLVREIRGPSRDLMACAMALPGRPQSSLQRMHSLPRVLSAAPSALSPPCKLSRTR